MNNEGTLQKYLDKEKILKFKLLLSREGSITGQ